MAGIFGPLEFLLICLASWLNQRERMIKEYLWAENRILREQFGKNRLRLTDDQRRRLAVLGKTLGRQALQEWASIVTPDTIMRWYRVLVAKKWDYSARRGPGRPPVILLLRKLVVRMAIENPRWGYDRIEGEIRKLGHRLSPTTVRNILKTRNRLPKGTHIGAELGPTWGSHDTGFNLHDVGCSLPTSESLLSTATPSTARRSGTSWRPQA